MTTENDHDHDNYDYDHDNHYHYHYNKVVASHAVTAQFGSLTRTHTSLLTLCPGIPQ